MKKKLHIFKSSGDAFILTLIALAIVSVFSIVVINITKNIQDRRKSARAKSIMTSVQQKIIDLALEPTSYKECNSVDLKNCQINEGIFSPFTSNPIPVSGSKCASEQYPCGVTVEPPKLEYSPSKAIFKTIIRYTGVDFSLKEIQIEQEIPKEILQTNDYDCAQNDSKNPLFKGLNADGKPICGGINDCPQGTYFHSIDRYTLQPICKSLPGVVSCNSGDFISSFSWQGESNVGSGCSSRIYPYEVGAWWDGGWLQIETGSSSKGSLKVEINTWGDAVRLGSPEYYANKGVESWAIFNIQFSGAKGAKMKTLKCNKIKLHNDSVDYWVNDDGFGYCNVFINEKRIEFRGDAKCGKDIMCNKHWYTIYVEDGAAETENGLTNRKTKRQFKVDPH